MCTKQKIIFFGSDEIAIPCLNALREISQSLEICGVLTQPDRRSGRGRKLMPNPIKKWALEFGIPVMDPEKPGIAEAEWIEELGADLVLIMAYGHILKNDILNIAPQGCFNLHASLLPKYRGASPIETAVAMGEVQTGVTLMKVIPQMDAGPVIDSESVQIEVEDTGLGVRSKIAQACIPLLARNISGLLTGDYLSKNQNDADATYCRKLSKADGCLDFNLPARELLSRHRAFSGWPGSYFFHGDTVLRVGKISINKGLDQLQPGHRCKINQNTLIVGTATGAVEILELQKPGGTMLPIADFLRGYCLPKDIIFESPRDQASLIR